MAEERRHGAVRRRARRAPGEPEGLSASALRRSAEERGYPVTHRQFADYRRWGLLPEPDADGHWPASVVDRLVRIRELGQREPGKRLPTLPRRVLTLRREFWPEQTIPPESVRDAMRAILPTIAASAQKMRRLQRAAAWLERNQMYPTANPTKAPRWTPPPRADWDVLLREVNLEHPESQRRFDEVIGLQDYHAALLAHETVGTGYDVGDIPPEERVTLLTVLYLARIKLQREQAARAAREEVASSVTA